MPESTADTPQSFEGALSQLQQIVHELEDGQLGLELSLSRFEEGIRILRSCFRILEQAERQIEILTGQDAAGNPLTAPFDATATFEGGEKPVKKPGRRRTAARPGPSEDSSEKADSEAPDEGGLF
jgi:exodeoxyribonuclease VII small subunit